MPTPHDFRSPRPAASDGSSEPHGFEEQLWPINVALVVLGGFVSGAIIVTSSFDDPRLAANGYVRLGALVLTLVALMWIASRLGNQTLRRTLQLAALMSLIVHVAVILLLVFNKSDPADKNALAAEVAPEAEMIVQQDFMPEVLDNPDSVTEFDKPIDVAALDLLKEEFAAREQPIEAPAPQQAQPAAAPTASESAQPSSVKAAERREAAPRRGNPSKLKRRAAEAKINRDNPSPLLPEVKTDEEPVAKLEPRDAAVARQQTAAPSAKPPGPGEVDIAQRPRETRAPTRRQTPEPAPELSSTPLAKNRSNEPRELPRADKAPSLPDLAPSAAPVVRDAAPAGPAADKLARANLAAPAAAKTLDAKALDAAPGKPTGPAGPSASAASRPDERPSLASSGVRNSPPQRSPALPDARAIDAAAADQPEGAAPRAVAQQPAGPAATTLSRARNDRVGKSPLSADAPSEPALQPRAVAQARPQRGQPSDQPTINPSLRPSPRPARSTSAAQVAASPVAVDNTAIGAQSGGPDQPSAGPAPTMLAKNDAGLSSAGAGRNLAPGPAGATGDGLPITTPFSADHRSGPSGSARGPARAGGGGGASGGSPNAASHIPGRANSRSTPGAGAAISLSADSIADSVRAPPGDGGGAYAASPDAAADGPMATQRGDAGKLPIGAMAIEGPSGDGIGAGTGSAPIARAAGSQDGGTGLGRSGSGTGGGGASRASNGGPAQGASGGGNGLAGRSLGGAPAINTLAEAPSTGSGDGEASEPRGGSSASAGGSAGDEGGDRLAPPADVNAGRSGAGGRGDSSAAIALGPTRPSVGVPGDPNDHLPGMAAGDVNIDSSPRGGPGNGISSARSLGAGDPEAPRVGVINLNGSPGRGNLAGALHGAPGVVADLPDDSVAGGGTIGSQNAGPDAPAPGPSVSLAEIGARAAQGIVGRRPGSMPVEVAALEGAGGLGAQLAPDVGSLDHRARRDSEMAHIGAGRFLGREIGGALSVDGRAREPARAFAGRGGQRHNAGAGLSQSMQRTEDAVELGLDFLARHQMPEGNWSLHRFGVGRAGYENEQAQFRSDTAATALSLLSFLGAGYDHFDDRYQNSVRAGLEFLVKNQKPNGDLYLAEDAESNKSAWLYSHGMATIALCEAYGMTGDENLREPAQRAIDFIVAAQHPSRGGWRYQPQHDSDTSVSGWQLMALKSGELSGLTVPPRAYELARKWLDGAQAAGDHTEFVYNPFAPDTAEKRHGRRPTTTMTAVGLLMRLYLGRNRDDPLMKRGAEHLVHHLPSRGTRQQPQGDTYYWYYATQVMFHMKGDNWRLWNERLHPLLVDTQVQSGPMAGSWDPKSDLWGKAAGRIYVTTMNLLSLEVYYRHLPIYESESK